MSASHLNLLRLLPECLVPKFWLDSNPSLTPTQKLMLKYVNLYTLSAFATCEGVMVFLFSSLHTLFDVSDK